jgi:RHS repeat-associated protein
LVDNNENLTASYTYTPYGTLSDHNGTSNNNFLFTGEQRDKQSNDYYLRARYYSPESGRFISIDPFEGYSYRPNTLNNYIYSGNNPINFVDLSGETFTVASVGNAMSISSQLRTTSGSSVQLGVRLMQNAIGFDTQRGVQGFLIDIIQDMAMNAVLSTVGVNFSSKTTAGTGAHTELERLLKNNIQSPIHWLGFDVHILPEVFVDSNGVKSARRAKGSLGVDILISTSPRGVQANANHSNLTKRVVLDLKTGKGWSKSKLTKLHNRYGNIPIIQMMIPIL